MDKLKLETPDLTAAKVAKIAEMFPGVVTEGKVNFDLLRTMLGDDVAGDEAYEFTWVGKREAIREAGRPIRKTLRPCIEESKDWDITENLYIEGDNLDVLKLLQESYLGKVKTIYIDPPYNTGSDFVYRDNFTQNREDYEKEAGVYGEDGGRLFRNTESNGRLHSDWCSMVYPRLALARNLLCNDGILLVSIGDREIANTIKILDEILGASNQVCIFIWKSRAKPTNAGNAKYRPQKVSEYVVAYSKKNPETLSHNVISAKERFYPHENEQGKFRLTTILTSNRGTFRRETMRFTSGGYTPDDDFRWKAGKETIDNLFESNHMALNDDGVPMEKKYANEESDPLYPIYTYVDSDISGTAESGKADLSRIVGNKHGFDTVKPVQLVKYLISTFSNDDGIVLDFFSGSSTTAQAVIELNSELQSKRKFIMVQIEEKCDPTGEAFTAGYRTICDIAKKRIRLVGDKIKDEAGILAQDLDIGFRVLKLDDTNMKDVYYTASEYTQGMLAGLESNIKDDRTDMDLLYGCLIEWGLPLSLPHTHEEIDGVAVHTYNGGDLIACFADTVSGAVVKEIARRKPLRAVFRDSSFSSSPEKINVEEIFKLLAPGTNVKVL
ncbi:MAG: site-specific DNA-methyltransferase [Synergistaceae bacterium]|jgi:adenine-specific DNA-methyltransferase|nr:site-specific DNA-methyltransferase [Synergistaceae bacterium]